MKDQLQYNAAFLIVPNALIDDDRTDVYHIAVFSALAKFTSRSNVGFPSISKLSALCKVSRRKLVYTINDLEKLGWIRKIPRYDDDGNQTSNLYELQQSLQGGASGARGGVHEVHGGGASGAPEQEPINKNQLNNKGRAVTDAFHARFVEMYGRKPNWSQASIQQARRLSERIEIEDIEKAIAAYFDREHWHTKGGRSWAQFHRHFDEMAAHAPKETCDNELERAIFAGEA